MSESVNRGNSVVKIKSLDWNVKVRVYEIVLYSEVHVYFLG